MKAMTVKNKISIGIISNFNTKGTIELIQKVSEIFYEADIEIFVLKEEGFEDDNLIRNHCNNFIEYHMQDDENSLRHYMIEKAKYEWVLLLESEEVLKEFNVNSIYKLISTDSKKLYSIEVINHNIIGEMDISYAVDKIRIFHKQAKEIEKLSEVYIEKNNYLIYKSDKIRNYIFNKKIYDLNKMIEENKQEPYRYFQLALAYLMNGNRQEAKENLQNAMELPIDTAKAYVQLMVVVYGNLLLDLEEYGEALLLENLYEYFENIADFLCLMGKIYLRTGFIEEAIREFSKALNTRNYIEQGHNSYIPNYHLGCIYEVVGDIEIAKKLYLRCGDYRPAKERLQVLE